MLNENKKTHLENLDALKRNNKPGRDFTVLVGNNGSGKSTILDAANKEEDIFFSAKTGELEFIKEGVFSIYERQYYFI